jgi:hypothetical protein
MAKKRIKRKRKKSKKKIQTNSAHASLCALAPVITDKEILEPIHQKVQIPQKEVFYRPTDKLVFVVLGVVSGCEAVFDLNQSLRVDRPLLRAFGYGKCADQSVIQTTLNAATQENVQQMEDALKAIWDENNLTVSLLEKAQREGGIETIDMDLSGMPASKKAEEAEKGYFAGKRNIYGRQLARILAPETQEIVAESLYPGNRLSCKVFKDMVKKMEQILPLDTKAQRRLIRLRLDGGFGTDKNINFALWRDYHLLVKMYSGNRAKVLAKSIQEWVDISPGSNNIPRQAGWVSKPHRYARKTKQLAIRMPKKKGDGYKYSVLVTTDMNADIQTTVTDYDGRSGVPESVFCQDNQGLGMRKRRKRSFVAQQMLMLLNQLAHNLIRWMQKWLMTAVEQSAVEQPAAEFSSSDDEWDHPGDFVPENADLVVKTLNGLGMKRFVRQILSISGRVVMNKGKVLQVILNPLYPLINRIRTAFMALLKPYGITVSLDEI